MNQRQKKESEIKERAIATFCCTEKLENERRDDGVDETDGKEGEKKRGRTLKDDMLFRRFCDCLFCRGMTSLFHLLESAIVFGGRKSTLFDKYFPLIPPQRLIRCYRLKANQWQHLTEVLEPLVLEGQV